MYWVGWCFRVLINLEKSQISWDPKMVSENKTILKRQQSLTPTDQPNLAETFSTRLDLNLQRANISFVDFDYQPLFLIAIYRPGACCIRAYLVAFTAYLCQNVHLYMFRGYLSCCKRKYFRRL